MFRVVIISSFCWFITSSVVAPLCAQEKPSPSPATTPEEPNLEDKQPSKEPIPPPKTPLIEKNFPGDVWLFYSGKKDAKLEETWMYIEDADAGGAYIKCTGKPNGYIRSKRKYRNFRLGMEWRFPNDEKGNSGVFIHTSGENRIWPTSLQVQLHQSEAGRVLPSGGAKTTNELPNVPMLSRPINQWNQCLITSINGVVTVTVNGQKVGDVNGCDPLEGSISLQSEGSEVHFRNIWIQELPASDVHTTRAYDRRMRRKSNFAGRAAFSSSR